ncbi:MAG TPA: hypothetical protein VF806_02865, partial [Anaerolineaceae bacterium]
MYRGAASNRVSRCDYMSRRDYVSRPLSTALAINHALAQAAVGTLDERGLMTASLRAITGLVGALGCSFIAVDMLRQALPAFTYGRLPAPLLNAWSMHLADHMLRERCGRCQVLQSTPGACPLHPAELGNTLAVYCLPLSQPAAGSSSAAGSLPAATTGVLHLYLPAG